MNSNKHQFLIISPSHLDIMAKGNLVWQAVVSTTVSISPMLGGSGRNVAENLARLGADVTLMTIVGKDIFGDYIIENTIKTGVKCEAQKIEDIRTPVYMALIDSEGKTLLDMMDGEKCHKMFCKAFGESYSNLIANANYIVTNTDIQEDLFNLIVESIKTSHGLLILHISAPSTAFKARKWIRDVDMLFLNWEEACLLLENNYFQSNIKPNEGLSIAHELVLKGPKTVVVSLGPDGVCLADNKGTLIYKPAISSDKPVVSTIGAGDALCAGFLYGLANNYQVQDSLSLGVAAAFLKVQSEFSVNPAINSQVIKEIVFKDDPE